MYTSHDTTHQMTFFTLQIHYRYSGDFCKKIIRFRLEKSCLNLRITLRYMHMSHVHVHVRAHAHVHVHVLFTPRTQIPVQAGRFT